MAKKSRAKTEHDLELGRKRIRDNRRWLAEYKLERGCWDCGYKAHSVALEFDHERGPKFGNMAGLAQRSRAFLMEEVKKCTVRCANCHRVRTYGQQWPGGTAKAAGPWDPISQKIVDLPVQPMLSSKFRSR